MVGQALKTADQCSNDKIPYSRIHSDEGHVTVERQVFERSDESRPAASLDEGCRVVLADYYGVGGRIAIRALVCEGNASVLSDRLWSIGELQGIGIEIGLEIENKGPTWSKFFVSLNPNV
jgi:hypothetical protein